MDGSRAWFRGLLVASLGASALAMGCDGRALLADPGEAGVDDVVEVIDRVIATDENPAPDLGTDDLGNSPDRPDAPDAGGAGVDAPDAGTDDAAGDAGVDVSDGGVEVDGGGGDDVVDAGPPVLCGNGRVDPGERCDTAIASGAGACLTTCDDRNVCTRDFLVGGGTCAAECAASAITAPVAGDGCCPPGATVTTDADCAARCGDGIVSAGETCDTAIMTGAGRCPAACSDGNVCTADRLNSPGTCTASCTATPITAAMSGDGCCPAGATSATDADCAARCGDGILSSGEACDTAIASGAGRCPTACNDGNACTTDSLTGGGTCGATCTTVSVTLPRNGDGCCPPGATLSTDNDCTAVCGDGVRSAGETCDTGIRTGAGACPTSCAAPNTCTTATLAAPGTCSASCINTAITTPRNGDRCCPPGATVATDNDCPARCGDAIVSTGESCDTGIPNGAGACPTSCAAPNTCTTVALANAGTCSASCTQTAITAPINGDRCCPAGATIATDNDCPVRCGDGVRSTGETCDTAIASGAGACPTACNDAMVCTRDVLVGSACTAACSFAPITAPMSGDGCCPAGATVATDGDCPARCGDRVVTAPEQCDDGNTTPGDGCGATCQREPRAYRMTAVTVQEPHFFFIIDITSNVNSEIAAALTMDRSMPADGLVDFSPIVYFRPGDQSSPSTPLTVDFAECTVPLTTTTCTHSAAPTLSTARNTVTGTAPCLAPLAGTFPTGRGINTPTPACFASDTVATLTIDLAGTALRLRNAQVGARYNADPATLLQTGLITGFLTQTEANNTRLPPTVAVVGGRTIASLLRAADQDRLADGTVGWWFYLNFTASPVRYVP